MADQYDYDEADVEELAAACKRLKTGKLPKDALVKHLKDVCHVLERMPQDVTALGSAEQQLPAVLGQKHVLHHTDKDVKMYTAACVAQMLRIWAPELPFDDRQMQQAFALLLWMIKQLSDHTAPTYALAVSTLQVLSQTKGYLLLLDLDSPDLAVEWMRALLESASEAGLELAHDIVIDMLSGMLVEEDAQEAGMKLLLSYLVNPEVPGAARVAKAVLQRCEVALKADLQKFLMRLILAPISSNSELTADPCVLVAELYPLLPQVVAPIIPHLSSLLAASEDAKRLEAVQMLARLFTSPHKERLLADFRDLLGELLLRYKDNKAAVRLEMLKLTPMLVEATRTTRDVSQQVLEAAAERLQDYDDKVRIAAVQSVASVAADSYSGVPQQVMEAASMRLRDTKLPVRKAALAALLGVFKAKVARSGVRGCQPVLWILSRVLLVVRQDPALKQHLLEALGCSAALPSGLSAADHGLLWVMLHQQAPGNEREAIEHFFKLRAALQADLVLLLELRKLSSIKEDSGFDPEALQSKMGRVVPVVARYLPDAAKAEAQLRSLTEVKDNKVVAALLGAFGFGATSEAHAKQLKDAVQRVGSKSPLADFLSTLAAWAGPCSWWSKETSQALLQLLLDSAAGSPGGGSPSAWQHLSSQEKDQLLPACYSWAVALGKVAPPVFAGMPEVHLGLMESLTPELQVLGSQLLARAALVVQRKSQQRPAGGGSGAGGTQRGGSGLPKGLLPRLKELASEGPGRAAKTAVMALYALLPPGQVQQELTELCEDLVAGLSTEAGAHAAAKLQAISSIGRLLPGVVAPHVQSLVSFVFDDYLYAVDLAEDGLGQQPSPAGTRLVTPSPLGVNSQRSTGLTPQLSNAAGEEPSGDMQLKAAAVKAVARACVPDSTSAQPPLELMQALGPLMTQLEGLLDIGTQPPFLEDAPELEGGCLRLAAASALLRLVRRHDKWLPSSAYVALGLMLQDPLEEVRRLFQAKLMRLVAYLQDRHCQEQLPAKYAAMLALAAMDPARLNKQAAANHLHGFVQLRRRALAQAAAGAAAAGAAGKQPGAAAAGGALTQQPEMMLPYALYLLAHHPDFPMEDMGEEDMLGALLPFQFMLQIMLAPLLQPGSGEPAAAALPLILKIGRTLKRTEDGGEPPCTPQLYLLSDMMAATAHHMAAQLLGAAPKPANYPATVVLPKALFKPGPDGGKGARYESHLPEGFTVEMDPDPAAPPVNGASSGGHGQAAAGGSNKARSRPRSSPGGAKRQRQQEGEEADGRGGHIRSPKAGGSPAKRQRRQPSGDAGSGSEADPESEPEVIPAPKQRGRKPGPPRALEQQDQQQPRQQPPASPAHSSDSAEAAAPAAGAADASSDEEQGGVAAAANLSIKAGKGGPGGQQGAAKQQPSKQQRRPAAGGSSKPAAQKRPGGTDGSVERASKQPRKGPSSSTHAGGAAAAGGAGGGLGAGGGGQQQLRTIVADASSPSGPSRQRPATQQQQSPATQQQLEAAAPAAARGTAAGSRKQHGSQHQQQQQGQRSSPRQVKRPQKAASGVPAAAPPPAAAAPTLSAGYAFRDADTQREEEEEVEEEVGASKAARGGRGAQRAAQGAKASKGGGLPAPAAKAGKQQGKQLGVKVKGAARKENDVSAVNRRSPRGNALRSR